MLYKRVERVGFIILASLPYSMQAMCDEHASVNKDLDSSVTIQSFEPHIYYPLYGFNSSIGGLSINLHVTSLSEFLEDINPELGTRLTADDVESKNILSSTLQFSIKNDDNSFKTFIKKFGSISYQKPLGHDERQELGFNAKLNGKFGIYFEDNSNGWKCEMKTRPRSLFSSVSIEGSLGCRFKFY